MLILQPPDLAAEPRFSGGYTKGCCVGEDDVDSTFSRLHRSYDGYSVELV